MSTYKVMRSSNNSLQHHGVKGQKWGIRRYRNSDGTRTSLGKRHDSPRKEAKKMTNEQLQEAINRQKLEKRYVDGASSELTKGQNFVENALIVAGTVAVMSFARKFANDIGESAGTTAAKNVSKAAKNASTAASKTSEAVKKALATIGMMNISKYETKIKVG